MSAKFSKWGKLLVTGPLVLPLYGMYKESSDGKNSETVDESEVDRIRDIIAEAREQGLSEINIEVSKCFADKCSIGASLPIEGVNISAEAKNKSENSGNVILSLKLNPDDIYNKIEKLARLHRDGVLSDKEFSAAKKRLIDKM